MSERDGGSAFPQANERLYLDPLNGSMIKPPEDGMTLRDYFAAQALIASMVMASSRDMSNIGAEAMIEGLANSAYVIADAMLKERAK